MGMGMNMSTQGPWMDMAGHFLLLTTAQTPGTFPFCMLLPGCAEYPALKVM